MSAPTKDGPIVIVVPGEPRAKQRARWSPFSKTPYTPQATVIYETAIAYAGKLAMRGRALITGPVAMTVDAFFSIKGSWGNRKKQDALCGDIRPDVKPDWDNVGKSASDGLNKIVYADDSQVVDCLVRKFYSDRPRLVIEVRPAAMSPPEKRSLPWRQDTKPPSTGQSKTSSE